MLLSIAPILLSLFPSTLMQEKGPEFSWLAESKVFSPSKTVFDINLLAKRGGPREEVKDFDYVHWRKVRLQKGKLGEDEVWKITIWKEEADVGKARIVDYRSESFWNKKKELIALHAVWSAQGVKIHREYRWRDGGLFLHVGPPAKGIKKKRKRTKGKRRHRSSWKPISSKARPRSLVLMLASTPYWNADQKKTFSQLDPWNEKTSEETLHRTEKRFALGRINARAIEGTQEGGIRYFVRRTDGAAYATAPKNKAYYEFIWKKDLYSCREWILNNPPMQANAQRILRGQWKKKGSELRNAFLGISLRPPRGKNWGQISDLEAPNCFGLETSTQGASFRIWMRIWGDRNLEPAIAQFKKIIKGLVPSLDDIKIKKIRFLRKPAYLFTFRGKDYLRDYRRDTRIIALIHRGAFMALGFRVLPSEKKLWKRDLKRIESSIKLLKPKTPHHGF